MLQNLLVSIFPKEIIRFASSQDFILEAFELHEKLFNTYLPRSPCHWDQKKKKLIFDKTPTKCFLWYCNIVFGIFGVATGFPILTFIIKWLHPYLKLELFRALINGIVLIPTGIAGLVLAFCIIVYGDLATVVLNQILVLQYSSLKCLRLENSKPTKSPNHQGLLKKEINSQNVSLLAIGVYLMVIVCFQMPITMSIFAVVTKTDVSYTLLTWIIPTETMTDFKFQLILLPIQIIVSIYAFSELSRSVSIAMLVMVMLLTFLTDLFNLLKRISIKSLPLDYMQVHRIYVKLMIINCWALGFTNTILFAAFAGAGFIACALNYATFKFYSKLPWLVYSVFPPFAFLVILNMPVIVKQILMPYTLSLDILRITKLNVQLKWKYWRRLIKSLQPFRLYGGVESYKIFLVQNSIKANYYQGISSYTITLLLSVPVESIFGS